MGIGTLPDSTTVAAGLIVKSADMLSVISALNGSLVGRNASGVATSGESLGTALYPWGNAFITDLIVGGSSIDVSGLTAAQNRVISGKTRSTSGQPFFLNPNGAAATVTIQGAATTLSVSINGTVTEVTTDIDETGLTTAPATNNTCAINDTSFVDQEWSKYFGEDDSERPTITIDTVGTAISSRVGQMISLKTTTSEIMFGFLKSATEFVNVRRGYFFDSSNAPIVRETIANNDTLTLLETGWIFITNDATTVDVTYTTPVYAYTAPGSPATGDYWFDMANETWKRYSGVAFVVINRTLLGVCVQDTSNCIGARSFDFDNSFDDTNTIDAEVFDDENVRSAAPDNLINIYGTLVNVTNTHIEWDNTADMETGSVAADTEYCLYLTTEGEPVISLEKPYDRPGDLKGRYHPYNNWRYVGKAKTDADSDWLAVMASDAFAGLDRSADFETSKDLIFDWATTTTATLTCSSMKLLNRQGAGKMIYGIDDTFNIEADRIDGTGTTNELASTTYQCWRDTNGVKKMAPDLTGVADANVLNSLSDSTAAFQTHLVQRWDEIYQTTDLTKGYVKAVSAEGLITCMDKDGLDLDLFPLGTEGYLIRMLSPPGLGEFRGRIGNVFNNSGSAIDDSHYTQIQERTEYFNQTAITDTGWTVRTNIFDIYQVNDWTGQGSWRTVLNFNGDYAGLVTSGTLTIAGIVFKTITAGHQSVDATTNVNVSVYNRQAQSGAATITWASSGNLQILYFSSDLALDKKPTFHK